MPNYDVETGGATNLPNKTPGDVLNPFSDIGTQVEAVLAGQVTDASNRAAGSPQCTPSQFYQTPQNPTNGVLSQQEGMVFYQRKFTVTPLTANHYQVNVDQPLTVPPGYYLEVDSITCGGIPDDIGDEPSTTPGIMVLVVPQGIGTAGNGTADDLGSGATSTPGFFGPGGVVLVAGAQDIMRPGGPVEVLAPDSQYETNSTTNPIQFTSTSAGQDIATSGGGNLVMRGNASKIVGGAFSILFCFLFAPLGSHTITINICLRGILLTDAQYKQQRGAKV